MEETLLIFTYAPAGLGHLRVMDALIDGRPKGLPYEVMGSDDRFIRWIHRLTSINPLAKKIFESFQYGFLEDIFTKLYVHNLRIEGKFRHEEIVRLVGKHPSAKKIVVVCTHFGLAHQLGRAKKLVEKETGKKIFLVVQVTDATSQHIWAVRGADVMFVPSQKIKDEFLDYMKQWKSIPDVKVIPYPLNPELTKNLANRNMRLDYLKDEKREINIAVPISGAATGLPYLTMLLPEVRKIIPRARFWIVAKETAYTKIFLNYFKKKTWVKILSSKDEHEVVNMYESLFERKLIMMEITKPSEQAFKAIIPPSMVGGCILLFMDPVGRQEYDNIDFLTNHKLVSGCRGLLLPKDFFGSALYIKECVQQDIFEKMVRCDRLSGLKDTELGGEGVKLLWENVEKLIS